MSLPTPNVSRSPPRRWRRQSPSPPPRRGRRAAGGRDPEVRRIVREVGGSANYPVLTKTNYNDWSLLMRVMLQARGLWDAVQHGNVDYHEDRTALEAILRAVPPEMISTLAVKGSAKEAWDTITTMRVGIDRVRKANAQKVRKEYEELEFRPEESIDDFSLRFNAVVNQLSVLGDAEPQDKVVEKFLRVVRPRFTQIVLAIETLLDVSTLSVEDITGRLRIAEEPPQAKTGDNSGKLLLTEEEWAARMKERKQGESSSGGRKNDNKKRRGGRRRGDRGAGSSGDGKDGAGRDVARDTCRNCGKVGHWAKDCRSKGKKVEAHLTQCEDDEPTLLFGMAVVGALGSATPPEGRMQERGAISTEHGAGKQGDDKLQQGSGSPARGTLHLIEEKVFAQLDGASGRDDRRWYIDTGATNHMTGARHIFSELDTNVRGTVKFGDGSHVAIEGQGSILFACKNGEHRALTGVYFIPKLTANIISVGQLDEYGCQVLIHHGVMKIRDQRKRLLAKVNRSSRRLYTVMLDVAQPVCLSARCKEEAWRWHARFGHLNFQALRKMGRHDMVRGLPVLDQIEQVCDACLAGKQRRAPFPDQTLHRANELLGLVHGDICGPISPATPSGNRYFLLMVDDKSRFMWLRLLAAKSQAAEAIKRFQAAAEMESGRKLQVLRTDRGGEFTSVEFGDYCADLGVHRQLTAPYSPQQNGVVERRNQTVVAMARSMMKAKNLPGKFWGEAVSTAVYLLNRSPTRSVEGMTPYQAWHGRPPAVHYLRTFGCIAHVKNVKPHLQKLDDRSTPMVFVGYEAGSKAYRVYNPVTGRVHVTRDVVFDEDAQWKWASAGEREVATEGEPFTVEYVTIGKVRDDVAAQPTQSAPAAARAAGSRQGGADRGAPSPARHQGEQSPPACATPVAQEDELTSPATPQPASPVTPAAQQNIVFATPPSNVSEGLDADHDDDAPLRFRTLDNILGPVPVPPLARRELFSDPEDLLLTSAEEPTTFVAAEQDQSWRLAMIDEMQSIEANQTWELVDPPVGCRPIGLKWVYKVKRNERGEVVRYKARLVAKGYVQRPGIDFEEVFAPVARMDSVRLLLAVAASEGWEVHHMDVKTAFLNGELSELVYVAQPQGFVRSGQEHKVLKLNKALYGLRQAPRAWNSKLDESLRQLGFQRSTSDHAMYSRSHGDARLLVGVYVDDLVITGSSKKAIGVFKEEMSQMFKMSDLGLLSYYLGIEVKQSTSGIVIGQAAYARKILENCGMDDCNPSQVPMETRLKLSKTSTSPPVDKTHYRSVVGSLRYLTHSRPDIMYAVGIVSRYMEDPREEHFVAVKHLLRYIAGTLNFGCKFGRRGEEEVHLHGYSDSDMAGDVDDRKSTTGIMFFLNNSPVSWQSQKQRVVALSSCEAEYIAAATAACQGVWLARLMSDIVGGKPKSVDLKVDNKSAISLSKNPVHHDRSKHIDTRYHYIRERIEDGSVVIRFVNSVEQVADIFTKSLGRVRFLELRAKIGIVEYQ